MSEHGGDACMSQLCDGVWVGRFSTHLWVTNECADAKVEVPEHLLRAQQRRGQNLLGQRNPGLSARAGDACTR